MTKPDGILLQWVVWAAVDNQTTLDFLQGHHDFNDRTLFFRRNTLNGGNDSANDRIRFICSLYKDIRNCGC
jgi:hypothetical protein